VLVLVLRGGEGKRARLRTAHQVGTVLLRASGMPGRREFSKGVGCMAGDGG
jgi:hypothetical protein